MDKHEALKIGQDFFDSLKTGDKGLIKKYSLEQLRMTLPLFSNFDQRQPWHNEILKQIYYLTKEQEKQKSERSMSKEKVELVILSFLSGILATIMTQWISKHFH